MTIKVSLKNSKMGAIPSVSLPSWTTCRPDCQCRQKCYAHRIERLRKNVRESYQHNLEVLNNDPDTYWRELEGILMMSRFFRFHVSGDIPSIEYLYRMANICTRQSHCEVLCFTKRYEWVNHLLKSKVLPKNLHLIFSVWKGLLCENIHNLPEAHVLYRDGTTTASNDAKLCNGNCAECAVAGNGCWTLQKGEQIMFHEH